MWDWQDKVMSNLRYIYVRPLSQKFSEAGNQPESQSRQTDGY